MTEQRILKGSTATLYSYPRVERDGTALLKQPVSVTVRIGTPAVDIPDEDAGVAATVDDLSAKATVAVAEGEEEVACSGVAVAGDQADVTSTEDSVLIDTYALSDGVYAVSIAYAIITENGGVKAGTITADVTFEDGVNTDVANTLDTPTTSTGDAAAMAITITGPGFSITGAGSAPTSVEWITALTYTRVPNFQRNRSYLVGDDVVQEVVHAGADDSATLLLAEQLLADIDANAPVKGWRVSKALTAAQTDLTGNGIAFWTATFDDGFIATWAQSFRIVRRLPVFTLTPTELLQEWSVIRQLVDPEDHNLEDTIASVWRSQVEKVLAKKKVNAEDIIRVDPIKAIWSLAVLRDLAITSQLSDRSKDDIEKRWILEVTELMDRDDWYDAPQDDASPSPAPEEPTVRAKGLVIVR